MAINVAAALWTFWILLVVIAVAQISALSRNQRRFVIGVNRHDYGIMLGEFLGRRHAGQVRAIDAAGKAP